MRLVLKSLFTPLVAASLTLATGLPALAGDWKPQKPVEMVIMAGQGGGADRLARLFQSIIQDTKNALSMESNLIGSLKKGLNCRSYNGHE